MAGVSQKKVPADVHKALLVPQDASDAHLHEGVDDHRGRGQGIVRHMGLSRPAGAPEEQLVGKDLAVSVENGLSSDQDIS